MMRVQKFYLKVSNQLMHKARTFLLAQLKVNKRLLDVI